MEREFSFKLKLHFAMDDYDTHTEPHVQCRPKVSRVMNERSQRIRVAIEARAFCWDGVSRVALATGMARNAIAAG